VTPVPPFPRVCRDSDDDLIIATAVAANADRLVTGDNDLLTLGKHHGLRIVTPRQFLDEL
jgi:predicted nucleic acid-binding protein